jgi:glycosyltransferase involved in cell wall biosynthesis
MKIAWFTPFSIKSAIGKYSQSVTNELTGSCTVDLWVNETRDLLPTGLNCFSMSEARPKKLKEYDFLIYNLGNHLGFHKDIFEISEKFPGIVILHDFVMHHFFAGYYLDVLQDNAAYLNNMETLYGKRGLEVADKVLQGNRKPVWETDQVVDFPFFEKALGNALGVIAHSRFLARAVRRVYLGPVAVIHHPHYSYGNICRENSGGRKSLELPEGKILLLSIGHVNPNKRIDKVIKAIGEFNLQDRIHYIVIGPHENESYFEQLNGLTRKHHLENSVRFFGYQPDPVMHEYMLNADAFVNLRYPPTEGASGSLLEQFYFAKPVIATDIGFFGELPDDCLMKIRPDHEESDLLDALQRLIADRAGAQAIGVNGNKFLLENLTPQKYRERFVAFLPKLESFKPVFHFLDRLGKELAQVSIPPENGLLESLSREISFMLPDAGETEAG